MNTQTRLIGSQHISPYEIQYIMGVDIETAIREHEHIRLYLRSYSENLLVSQYCDFTGENENEIIQFLNQYREEEELNNKKSY